MLLNRLTHFIIIAIILGLIVSITGCATANGNNNDITGSGSLETRTMNYAGFSEIVLSQGFDASISQDDSFSVETTLDDNLYNYLDIEQNNDTLHIGFKSGSFREYTAKVIISMPELNSLELSSAARAEIIDFDPMDSLDLEASSASRVFGKVNIQNGNFLVSSASKIQLEGSAEVLTLNVSSASAIYLDNFDVVDMDIELSGASYGIINVNGILNLGVHASSHLTYLGDPTITSYNVSGLSSVDHG